jgi:hypothetical protein
MSEISDRLASFAREVSGRSEAWWKKRLHGQMQMTAAARKDAAESKRLLDETLSAKEEELKRVVSDLNLKTEEVEKIRQEIAGFDLDAAFSNQEKAWESEVAAMEHQILGG